MYYTDDPVRDFLEYDRAQQIKQDRRPKCEICGEPLEEYAYLIDGQVICQECLDDNYKIEIYE